MNDENIDINFLVKLGGEITDSIIEFLPSLMLALVVFFGGLFLLKYLDKALTKIFQKTEFDEALENFVQSFINVALKILLAVLAIGILGVETTAFVAIFGAMAFAVGLALQGSLSNFSGGVLILFFKPFKIGDFIKSDSGSGTIMRIEIFNTILKSTDGKKIIVPNGNLSNNVITNYSETERRRVEFKIGIGYSDDIKLVRKVLEKIMADNDKIFNDDSTIAVSNLGDNAVEILFRFWTLGDDHWDVKCETLEKIKSDFDENNISFPFPQRDVHLYNEK